MEELKRKSSPICGRKPIIILGHDTRFLGREFSLAAAEVLANAGLTPLLCCSIEAKSAGQIKRLKAACQKVIEA